ncbi:zinc finger protein 485-like [Achroia grisella]|uniref:zinc finger protein 485-like n=1 Tax=Achroia grisella TaxID=688607 RepID=UPI0027D2E140|nr:zinc finger protein 485-like [Achroia grisella]
MSLELSTNDTRPICEGCLSVDRNLTPICDDESRSVYTYMLDQMEHINHGVLLCWECTATMRRILNFRQQVQTARNHLIRYMLQEIILSPLTQLSIKNNKTTYDHVYTHTDTKDEYTQNTNKYIDLTNNSHTTKNSVHYSAKTKNSVGDTGCDQNSVGDSVKTKNSVGDAGCAQNSVQCSCSQCSLSFLKIEKQDEFVDVEGIFVDENFDGNSENYMETILKSDSFAYEETEKKPKKSRKTRRKANKDEFNESDDEPLKKKAEDKEYKPRGRRKKRDLDGEETIDRRKNPRPKREKPAGVISNARVASKLQQLNVPSGQLEMVLLSWEEVEAERQRALTSIVFTRHEYRCYDCVLGFNHRIKLENHMKKHDPSAGELVCSVCRVHCRDAHALCAHRRRHRLRWRCVVCGGAWSRAGVAADHHARHHAHTPPAHTCSHCGHHAPSLGKLRNHMKNHAERQKCELCEKTFRDRASLRTHLFIHRGEKEYACPQCGKLFLFKKAMEVHLITHQASAHLYCYQCDMNFKNAMSYYQHVRYSARHVSAARLRHVCDTCGAAFTRAAALRLHRARHAPRPPHRAPRPPHHACAAPGCRHTSSSRAALRAHVRACHGGERTRNHVCHACGKAYTTKKTLEGHMRSHTGERPFHCTLCPSTFGYEAALYNHNKLVHLKIKSGRGRSATVPQPPQPSQPAEPPEPRPHSPPPT